MFLDYLVGNAEIEIDKASLNRLNEVSKMTPEDKNLVFSFLDAFILKTKLQEVTSPKIAIQILD
jgi:hypothetical protein